MAWLSLNVFINYSISLGSAFIFVILSFLLNLNCVRASFISTIEIWIVLNANATGNHSAEYSREARISHGTLHNKHVDFEVYLEKTTLIRFYLSLQKRIS